MLAQTSNTELIFGLITIVFAVNSGAVGVMFYLRTNDKKQFEGLKKTVRYKDTCEEVVKRIDQSAQDRHQEVKEALTRIEGLIKNNGNQKPRVQT